jgi:hypothetical protein
MAVICLGSVLCLLLETGWRLSPGGLYSVCYLRMDGGYLQGVFTLSVTGDGMADICWGLYSVYYLRQDGGYLLGCVLCYLRQNRGYQLGVCTRSVTRCRFVVD